MSLLFIQGPSGSGKSTLSRLLSRRLDWVHLDRDDIEGDRPLVYRKLKQELERLVRDNKSVIIDAPFLYEDEKDFKEWLGSLQGNNLVVSLKTGTKTRMSRRISRDLARDQVDNWTELLQHEEEVYKPLSGALLLSGEMDPHVLEDVVVWHLGAEDKIIREASEDDLDTVWDLKKKIIEDTFSRFLYPDELFQEINRVASREAVENLMQKNTVYLAEKNDVPWALLAISPPEEDDSGKRYQKVFSGYSRGEHAATAISIKAFSFFKDVDYWLAWAYRDNEQSKHVLRSSGFAPRGDSHINELVPRVPVEHWVLHTENIK